MKKNIVLVIIVIVIVLGTAVFSRLLKDRETESALPATQNTPQAPAKVNIRELNVGQKAPDFSITTVNGETLTLSGLQNQVVVLTSGAAWCPTCIIENKNFRPVYEEVRGQGVEFITVDIDPVDTPEAVRTFQETYAPWHNVHVDSARQLINDYGFWRFEITYIIDREGIIRFVDLGITSTERLREQLDNLV